MDQTQPLSGPVNRPDSEYEPGALLEELTVTDLTVDGKAVARCQGRVVFLDAGLPGEAVSARVVKTARRIIHARTERVLSPSPHAVAPWCPHAADCGACSWQHFSLEAAREWKQKHVRETLARIGKTVDPAVAPLVPSPLKRAYRTKMSFAFAPIPGRGGSAGALLGLRRFREKTVVEVTGCGMQRPAVMQLLRHVRQSAGNLGLEAWQGSGTGYLRFLVVHTPLYAPQGKEQMLVECVTGPDHGHAGPGSRTEGRKTPTNADKVREMGLDLMKEFALTGFVHTERDSPSDVAQGGKTIFQAGSGEYQEAFGPLVLTVPHNAFLQTNSAVAGLLYAGAAEEAGLTGREVVWDLYSGVGSIALYLATRAREAHGFEAQTEAVAAARANSATHGHSHCHFHSGSLSPSLLAAAPRPDVIVADPPRAGLGEAVCQYLLSTPARRLVYLSCDPGTQARDIARLASAWRVRRSRPYDMFPYTPHVENIVTLDRIAGKAAGGDAKA